MAQENREPVSDQDFFSQYLQPTGTPAAGADDPVTALPSDDDAEAGADAPVGAGMTGPQAVPIGVEPSPHAAGPAVPDDGFDGVPPAGAYPARALRWAWWLLPARSTARGPAGALREEGRRAPGSSSDVGEGSTREYQ